jgi:hypothetical protein
MSCHIISAASRCEAFSLPKKVCPPLQNKHESECNPHRVLLPVFEIHKQLAQIIGALGSPLALLA